MFTRKLFKWVVQIQRANGEIVERTVESYWDPAKDFVLDAVVRAGAAMEAVSQPRGPQGQVMPHVGLTAVLSTD